MERGYTSHRKIPRREFNAEYKRTQRTPIAARRPPAGICSSTGWRGRSLRRWPRGYVMV